MVSTFGTLVIADVADEAAAQRLSDQFRGVLGRRFVALQEAISPSIRNPLDDTEADVEVGDTSVRVTLLVDGAVAANVTFNWFEWGDFSVEKDAAKRLGYTTENVRIVSQAAFTQRDPKRPAVCGVTSRAPTRGVYTFWVEPIGGAAAADPCVAPTKLMELLLNGGQ